MVNQIDLQSGYSVQLSSITKMEQVSFCTFNKGWYLPYKQIDSLSIPANGKQYF
jgi:hypothetical protein